MEEVWKDIDGYEGFYQVSNLGNVRSVDRYITFPNGEIRLYKGKILKPSNNGDGYLFLDLSKNGRTKSFRMNRLVAEAFIPNPNNHEVINHIDHDRLNNRIDNLEWCSAEYNARYSSAISICQYDIAGKFLREWEAISDATRESGINTANITQCCKGKRLSAGGYIWKYKEA